MVSAPWAKLLFHVWDSSIPQENGTRLRASCRSEKGEMDRPAAELQADPLEFREVRDESARVSEQQCDRVLQQAPDLVDEHGRFRAVGDSMVDGQRDLYDLRYRELIVDHGGGVWLRDKASIP